MLMRELIRNILKEEVKITLNEAIGIKPNDFCSPLEGILEYSAGNVVSKFGHRRPAGHRHAGVDYKADSGDIIRAPYGGEVEKTKIIPKCGGVLIVHHGSGLRTKYCHVSKFSVPEGEIVVKGQKIGETGGGSSDVGKGNALGPHLHYEIHPNTSKGEKLNHGNGVDPEEGWVNNSDCESQSIVNKNLKSCAAFSGRRIPRDIFIKTFELGYFIRVDGTSVDGRIELSDGIYESDPGSPPGEIIGMNATTFIEYAKLSNITDNGDQITIDNVWVACKLNQNVVTAMENETLTRDEKTELIGWEKASARYPNLDKETYFKYKDYYDGNQSIDDFIKELEANGDKPEGYYQEWLDKKNKNVVVKKKVVKKSNDLPENFALIPGGMNNFRTDQPNEAQFLKIFNDYPEIKTVLQVNGSRAWEKGVIEGAGLKHIKIDPHKGYAYGKGHTTSINKILSVMNEGGVLIHCTHGADRTGYAVAVHLMDQGIITGKEALWEYTTKYNSWDKRGYICSPHKVKRYGGGIGNWGYIKYMEAFYPLTEWCKVGKTSYSIEKDERVNRYECHSCKNVTHLA